ncbi:MAG: ABC transporter permease, partial [Gemmatimonadetes bacterium]|nr:ABC transporter permease [Gemmatimonadota bacterium]
MPDYFLPRHNGIDKFLRELLMIKNYLTVAIRNIARNKTFSAINILGLAIGMACCILILLYVQDGLSYDQHHEHAHRIYRVAVEGKIAGTMRQYAVTPFPMGPALVKNYPEVIDAVRFSRADPKTVVGDQHGRFFYESGVVFTDPNFFQVFNFPLSKGNPRTAFSEPHSVVITEAIAQKYFGEQEPVGQILSFNDKAFKVTGVLKDTGHITHFQLNFLASPMSRDWCTIQTTG